MIQENVIDAAAKRNGELAEQAAIVNASNSLEGISPSALTLELQALLVNQKITFEQAIHRVLSSHAESESESESLTTAKHTQWMAG